MKLLLLLLTVIFASDGVIVPTTYGPIEGIEKLSALDKNYFSFQRIPYMKPPVGQLRFRVSSTLFFCSIKV